MIIEQEIKTRIDFNNFWIHTFIPLKDKIRKEYHIEPFVIIIKPLKKTKTYRQLKGFHLLCNMMIPFFKEFSGEICDLTTVKNLIKLEAGYYILIKGEKIPKSCKDATLEEMRLLIMTCEKLGAELEIPNIKLEPKYWTELENYYKETNENTSI